MALLQNPPNTVILAGIWTEDGTIAASEVIVPGMLIEMNSAANVVRWRKSTQVGLASNSFAMHQTMLNKSVDDVYNAGDLVQAGIASPGCIIWGLIASGASIIKGAPLSDAGGGLFKAASGVTNARAFETVNNTNGTPGAAALAGAARIRVEFL